MLLDFFFNLSHTHKTCDNIIALPTFHKPTKISFDLTEKRFILLYRLKTGDHNVHSVIVGNIDKAL